MFRPALALFWSATLSLTASAIATLSIEPSQSAVSPGQEFEIAFIVSADVGDLSCYAISIDFDPAILEYVSSSEGTLFSTSPDPNFFQHSIDALGDDLLSDCVLGFGTSVLAPGEIARLRLRAIDDGSSAITIASSVLRDVDRAVIGAVQHVHGSATITPTTTPIAGSLRLIAGPNPSAGPVWFRSGGPIADFRGELCIFDAQGRLVMQESMDADLLRSGTLRWNGRDLSGSPVASGLYLAILRQGGQTLGHAKLFRLE